MCTCGGVVFLIITSVSSS
uniref:Uncharacterized protein n=1 Tax=Anguilla anguilla TaxID=7936 RepID=A0A0E9R4X5_ANGAN